MCGITGFWRPGASPEHDRPRLSAMMDTLVHRGPDGRGMHLDPPRGLGMGHTRLAIIDLNSGDQPLYSPDRSCVLTINGELYDYKLHRTRLVCDGARFSTKTDAEIALHLYERHGLDFVHHLRGEFALALYDGERQRLVLLRDRFGIKPLYFARRDAALYWGSEVKAIVAHPEVPARLDARAVLHQMMQTMVPGTTAFEGIEALRPGHLLVVQCVGERLELSTHRWWNAEFPRAEEHDDDQQDDAQPRHEGPELGAEGRQAPDRGQPGPRAPGPGGDLVHPFGDDPGRLLPRHLHADCRHPPGHSSNRDRPNYDLPSITD